MSYGGKKPYLFIEDSPVESHNRPTFFQKSSIHKQGLFKKPYLEEFPEWTLSLTPPRRYGSSFRNTTLREKRRLEPLGALEIVVLNEKVTGSGMNQELWLELGFKKLGTFSKEGMLTWEVRSHDSDNYCSFLTSELFGFNADVRENGTVVKKVIWAFFGNGFDCYNKQRAFEFTVKLTWTGVNSQVPLKNSGTFGTGRANPETIVVKKVFTYYLSFYPCQDFFDNFTRLWAIDETMWWFRNYSDVLEIKQANNQIEVRHPNSPVDEIAWETPNKCCVVSKLPADYFLGISRFTVSIDFTITVPIYDQWNA